SDRYCAEHLPVLDICRDLYRSRGLLYAADEHLRAVQHLHDHAWEPSLLFGRWCRPRSCDANESDNSVLPSCSAVAAGLARESGPGYRVEVLGILSCLRSRDPTLGRAQLSCFAAVHTSCDCERQPLAGVFGELLADSGKGKGMDP